VAVDGFALRIFRRNHHRERIGSRPASLRLAPWLPTWDRAMVESDRAGRRMAVGPIDTAGNVINSIGAATRDATTRAGRAKGATLRPNPTLAGQLLEAGASTLL
jgi:hypothetical protein